MKKISDMYLAAMLLAYGAKLESIDKSNPRRKLFTFSGEIEEIWVLSGGIVVRVENPDFETINTRWAGNSLMFPPNYPDCIRKMKSVVHNE